LKKFSRPLSVPTHGQTGNMGSKAFTAGYTYTVDATSSV
jgi:hypothetical protein